MLHTEASPVKRFISRQRVFALLFNPIYLIIILSLSALLITTTAGELTTAYGLIVLGPVLLYLLYYYLSKFFKLKYSHSLNMISFGNIVILTCQTYIYLTIFINLLMIINTINYYGGFDSAINNFGATHFVNRLQMQGSPINTYTILINYMCPVFLIPLIIKRWSTANKLIIPILLIFTFISMGLYGARIIFLDLIFAILITQSFKLKINAGYLTLGFIFLVVLITMMSYLQSTRTNISPQKGLEEIGKYYSVSTIQGARIIKNDTQGQPLYWMTKPLFGIPVFSSLTGIQGVYEGIFGKVPIKSRKDDFAYAEELGADPRYNTLSLYGYLFLDLGMMSILIIFIIYILLDYTYYLFLRQNIIGLLLFPSLYNLTSDQLRTVSIYANRTPFIITAAIIICTLYLIDKSYIRNQNNFLATSSRRKRV